MQSGTIRVSSVCPATRSVEDGRPTRSVGTRRGGGPVEIDEVVRRILVRGLAPSRRLVPHDLKPEIRALDRARTSIRRQGGPGAGSAVDAVSAADRS
jgi:hypothetical protein